VTLEAIDVTHDELVMNGVSVQMKLAKDLPLVQGDRVQLLQVLVNLIINAIEAMNPHAAGARDLLIRTVKTKSGSVLVAVCDSGPGVDPCEPRAHLRRILHHGGRWFGNGPIDLPRDHPGAWGTTVGAAPE
jgi:C4-dicarboxylate-specific signal transduction histidine kinase